MAYISYIKLWESEFDKIVSSKDRIQDVNIYQLKLKVNDAYIKDEKITANFEPSVDPDVINKAYLDKKISKIEGHLLLVEKDYNEFKLLSDKKPIGEVLIKRVKTTIQKLYDKGLFDIYTNADEVLKDFLSTKGDLI